MRDFEIGCCVQLLCPIFKAMGISSSFRVNSLPAVGSDSLCVDVSM